MTPTRLPAVLLVALVLAYALPGIFGHDPWKPDEPYTFGIAAQMLRSGDWLVPTVGGIPFVEKPPLYYWTAAIMAHLGSDFLVQHDAARLASVFFVVVCVAAVAAAARLAWAEEVGALAALLFIGTVGLVGHAQRMQVDLALLAGFAIAALGLAACIRDRPWAGVVVGLGVAAGFLAKGLFAPAAIGITALLLPLLFESWRTRAYATQLAIAAAIAIPVMAVWPALLWLRSPELFEEWFWANNVGRFTGASTEKLGAYAAPGFWPSTLPWFLFPAWIFAALALWRNRRAFWDSPALQLGTAMALAIGVLLFLSRSARSLYALPLLVPVALLAVGAAKPPGPVIDRSLSILSVTLGVVAILLVWTTWLLLLVHGRIPASIAIDAWMPRRFDMPFAAGELLAAMALTLGFALLVIFRARLAAAGLVLWVAALALTWGLAHTLLLPWLDYARSFRGVYAEIAKRLPADTHCIVMNEVGESERAMAEYYLALPQHPRFVREDECGAMLWVGNSQHNRIWPGPGRWKLAWRGHRPGETVEGFDLFVRPEAPIPGETWDDPRRTGGR